MIGVRVEMTVAVRVEVFEKANVTRSCLRPLSVSALDLGVCRPWPTYGDDLVSNQFLTYGTIRDSACFLEICR